MEPRLTTFRAFRHRDYRLYFFGQLVSFTGWWMQTTALQWLTYQLTERSLWTSLIATASILPTLFLGGLGGALADRFPKRGLIAWTQGLSMVQALMLTALVFFGRPTPWHLLIFALASGVVNAVDLPARLSFVMDMVGRADVVNAVALNSLMFNAARVAGPWLGAVTLQRLGPGACFLANAVSYVAVLAGLALMRATGAPPTASSEPRSSFGGWRHLTRRPTVGILVLLTGLISVFGWPFLALLPALAHRTLNAAADDPTAEHGADFGRLLAGMGSGALLAALTLATFSSPLWRRFFLGFGVAATAVGLIGLSVADHTAGAVAACGLAGFGLVLFNATSQSVVQLSTDDHNRGQVMGVWSIVISGAMPLGNQIFGPVADRWDVGPTLRVMGAGCLTAGLVAAGLMALTQTSLSDRSRGDAVPRRPESER